ncbi:MAG: DNA-3-methyladenine glycosylase 2 family protein [Ignavibacteriales bacterium]|nr:DNA-3-methyladenine glycosylase 2 family protein [Ignavibacteriales bacterium]
MNNEFQKALEHLKQNDSVLSSIISNYGNRNLTPHRKYFNLLLGAIIGQQLSMKAARSIRNRVFQYFNENPTPQKILETEDQILRSLGLSNAKVRYVKDLSHKILTGELNLKRISKRSDEEIINELTKVKGVGVWSAHMFLIFVLARLNILPTGDLGIRKAVMINYGLKKLPDEQKIKLIARKYNWEPYCSVASLLLWHSLDNNK